ncbi:MAG: hypothetical protein JRF38_15585 [Deltaproteobacteria bacterium]|jgi:hypothetical protein|nr:hypothetical protein [Deltaproteobacteria bacterium]
MKKFTLIILLFVSIALFAVVRLPMAQNLTAGQEVFNDFCLGCQKGAAM